MTLAAAHVFAGDRGQHGGRALHRRALQQVGDGAQAAELFAAAGAARAAVLELGQRLPWPVDSARGFAVQHMHAAVQRSQHRHHRRRVWPALGDQRATRLPWPRAASCRASSMPS
jgi:hypothetical protein